MLHQLNQSACSVSKSHPRMFLKSMRGHSGGKFLPRIFLSCSCGGNAQSTATKPWVTGEVPVVETCHKWGTGRIQSFSVFQVDVRFPQNGASDPNLVTVTGRPERVDEAIDHLLNLEEEYVRFCCHLAQDRDFFIFLFYFCKIFVFRFPMWLKMKPKWLIWSLLVVLLPVLKNLVAHPKALLWGRLLGPLVMKR